MQNVYKSLSHIDSYTRMGEILNSIDTSFPEMTTIPDESRLTYSNGFYINNCTALFIDIRQSSSLPDKHTRPKLAKLYRVYISEMVAVMNDNSAASVINIVGDCVSGIFHTPNRSQVENVFATAFKAASIIDIMNYKFSQVGITEITVGMGIAYGRALMVKAGFKGSGINDVVWMGDVANEAAKLCSHGNKTASDREIMISSEVYDKLGDHNRGLLEYNYSRGRYHGNVIHKDMNAWLVERRGY